VESRWWIGGDGNWNDTAHWSSDGETGGASVPGDSDMVIIYGTATISLQSDISTNSIEVHGSAKLVTNNHNLAIQGIFLFYDTSTADL
jgi:hypothetical protein